MAKLKETKSGETIWCSTDAPKTGSKNLTGIISRSGVRGIICATGATMGVALSETPFNLSWEHGGSYMIYGAALLGAISGGIEEYRRQNKAYKESQ